MSPPPPLSGPPMAHMTPIPFPANYRPFLRPPPTSLDERAFGSYLVAYSSMASLAWLYWDVVRTLPEEVNIIWPAPWSKVKCLYFFIRYMGVVQQATSAIFSLRNTPAFSTPSPFCMGWQVYQTSVGFAVSLAVEYVMMLRVFALYSCHRILPRVLISLFIVQLCAMLGSMIHFLLTNKYDGNCLLIESQETVLIYCTAFALFHLLLFILTLGKFMVALKDGWGATPIMTLLMRDGTWSFFVLVSTVLSNSLVVLLEAPPRTSLLSNWLGSILSFVGYRNLLNTFEFSSNSRTNMSPGQRALVTHSIDDIFTTQYTHGDTFQDTYHEVQLNSMSNR